MARHEHSQEGNVDIKGRPRLFSGSHPLAMVYGGGGAFGIAYNVGVAVGLASTGIAVREAPALGTSAGAWAAATMALGLGYEAFDGMTSPSIPNRRATVLYDRAHEVFGDVTNPLVAVSAVSVRSGRRHILDGDIYPLAKLAAASSAVPGLFPPFRLDGHLYIDGGTWSVTSVDAAAEADHVIVIAPMSGPVLGPIGRSAGFMLARELRIWQHRHPHKLITMIRPNHEIGRLAGRNPLGLFDAERARLVYPLAVEQGRRWGEKLSTANAA